MSVGYFASPLQNPPRGPKVHVVDRDGPVCRTPVKGDFQWCSNNQKSSYVDCKKCKKIIEGETIVRIEKQIDAMDSVNSIDWLGILSNTFGEECKHDVTEKLKRNVSESLDSLNWRESFVVVMRSRGMTLRKVGELLDVTGGRARQLEAKGFRKLRHPTRLRRLNQFM